jgi:hypothetical protein
VREHATASSGRQGQARTPGAARRPLRRRLRTLLTLSGAELALLVEALGLVSAVRVGLWLLPSPVILRRVRALAAHTPGERRTRDSVAAVIWAVETVASAVPGATCLTQAIAALILLRRRGLEARLRLGVAVGARGELLAHAWLERQGRILLGAREAAGLKRLPDLTDAPTTAGTRA